MAIASMLFDEFDAISERTKRVHFPSDSETSGPFLSKEQAEHLYVTADDEYCDLRRALAVAQLQLLLERDTGELPRGQWIAAVDKTVSPPFENNNDAIQWAMEQSPIRQPSVDALRQLTAGANRLPCTDLGTFGLTVDEVVVTNPRTPSALEIRVIARSHVCPT